MDVSVHKPTNLITDGLFRHIRHPIYAFSMLLMLCSAVIVPTIPMAVAAVIHIVLWNLKARNEERHLLHAHGEVYRNYLAANGTLLSAPAWTGSLGRAAPPPSRSRPVRNSRWRTPSCHRLRRALRPTPPWPRGFSRSTPIASPNATCATSSRTPRRRGSSRCRAASLSSPWSPSANSWSRWAIRGSGSAIRATAPFPASSFGSSTALAGTLAWYYEHDGMVPLLIGHSQGGMLAIRTLYELAGAFADSIPVTNPLTGETLKRTTIVDPQTGVPRPVVGTQGPLRRGARHRQAAAPAARTMVDAHPAAAHSRYRRRIHRLFLRFRSDRR